MMGTKYRKYYAFLIMVLGIHLLGAQAKSSEQQWYTIYNRAVTNDGRWIFFTKTYDVGNQEGVLRDTRTGKEITITAPGKFFLNSDYFMVKDAEHSLVLYHLRTGKKGVFEDAVDFKYDAALKILLLQTRNMVIWQNLEKNQKIDYTGYTKMQSIEDTPCFLLYGNGGTAILNKKTGIATPLYSAEKKVKAVTTSAQKNRLNLLVQEGNSTRIVTVDYLGKEIASVPISQTDSLSTYSFVTENILAAAKPFQKKTFAEDTVEVWSNHDQALKPRLMNILENAQELEITELKNNETLTKSYHAFATSYYLVFEEAYELEVQELANYKFTVSDMARNPKIVLRNRSSGRVVFEADEVRAVHPSEKGNYLLYYKDRDWYCYEILTGKNTNITASSGIAFHRFDRLNTTVPHPVDRPYFTEDYQSVYLTSQKDLWRYTLRNNQLQKITNYKDKNMSFRIKERPESKGIQPMIWNSNNVLQGNNIILKMENHENELEEGLAVLSKGKLTFIEEPSLNTIDQIQSSEESVTYVIQNAHTPPALMLYNIASDVKSNKQQTTQPLIGNRFPHTELRHWINSKGESTYTTVVLPPDYSPLKKYPAVVRIYENEAKRYKEFIYPSYHNTTGFNRALLAEQGYIVILPKITYSVNKVGESAVRSVEEAVKKMQTWYSIDEKNIGLIGHSFGGYETNYIITQSNMFKTAISGSGIANIVSDYFTVHQMYLNSNIARYTNQQFSFTGDFYQLKREYAENNPILMADQIKTPLLLWSGKDDDHVEWRQSVEMFMALTSLKKEVRLLLFPHDRHVLTKAENQTEATRRINEWFGYYLKNGKKPVWY